MMMFPIDVSGYKRLSLSLDKELSAKDKKQLLNNCNIVRDMIVFVTAYAGVRGLGGHTGGAYDVVPAALIVDGFMQGSNKIHPVLFDAAGHRVILQYVLLALQGSIPMNQLLKYREFKGKLPGHPELGVTPGLKFSSGRLGHLWSFANGVALATKKRVVVFDSDGSLQEGNEAEAARFAVANNVDVTVFLDDNDVTIAGHPSEYMRGYDPARFLSGCGLDVTTIDSRKQEDVDVIFEHIRSACKTNGPRAIVNKTVMAKGIASVEGSPKAHDVVDAKGAIVYLEKRGHKKAAKVLRSAPEYVSDKRLRGSSDVWKKNRNEFGKIVAGLMKKDKEGVLVLDCDLAGSTGLVHIKKAHPDRFISGGVMERNNFATAAGFGSVKGNQGVVATFSAFLEMLVSEISMARLNEGSLLAHFSHAGVDWMADNTCHYGTSIFFADNGFGRDSTRLYFPADPHQLRAILEKIYAQRGLRFVFSTRSAVPEVLKDDGSLFFDKKYKFTGVDEVIREGEGYIVSYGEVLCRAIDASEQLREKGLEVGVINKPVLNVVDEKMMRKLADASFVLVAESQNAKTGLGVRFGSWLLERGFSPKYGYLGVEKPGQGGLDEHLVYQDLDPKSIVKKIERLLG